MAPATPTSIHEAAHVVVGYSFGMRFMHVAVLDNGKGETIPECSWCEDCWEYYHGHDPARFPRSIVIQNAYRRDAAVAVAGELAQRRVTGCEPSLADIGADREKLRNRASVIHLFVESSCFNESKFRLGESCRLCDRFVSELRESVERILQDPVVWNAVVSMADQLNTKGRMEDAEISKLLDSLQVGFGSMAMNELPGPPSSDAAA